MVTFIESAIAPETDMLTILSIIGARPQFIKHAPMQVQLQRYFRSLTLHTGQHYDYNMSQVFFQELGIPKPDYMLESGTGKPQAEQTGMMMTGIERICSTLKPDGIVLYGDTNSTLAGALVASKMGIPIFHVEAGIRSFNRAMPEEINRIIADSFSSMLFCPVPEAVDNLRKEGIVMGQVFMTGDVMCDALQMIRPSIHKALESPYYFATIHRPYNTDEPNRMQRILASLNALAYPVIFPIHPRTLARIQAAGLKQADYPNIKFIEPVGYIASISYQLGAPCIITDSGGIQKEAYMLGRKCITLRSETEWNESLEHGWNTLVFEDIESIPKLVMEQPGTYIADMFGDGKAAERIARLISGYYSRSKLPQNQEAER